MTARGTTLPPIRLRQTEQRSEQTAHRARPDDSDPEPPIQRLISQ